MGSDFMASVTLSFDYMDIIKYRQVVVVVVVVDVKWETCRLRARVIKLDDMTDVLDILNHTRTIKQVELVQPGMGFWL